MRKINKLFFGFLIVLVVVFLIFVAGVNVDNYKEINNKELQDLTVGNINLSNDSSFIKISKTDLLNILKETNTGSNQVLYSGRSEGIAKVAMDSAQSAPSTMPLSESIDYSGTNVQVSGVDEGDIVKTNGKKIFIGRQNELIVINNVSPPINDVINVEISKNDELYFNNETIQSILIDEKNELLYLITQKYFTETKFDKTLLFPQRIDIPVTVVFTYDIKDTELKKLNQLEIDGYYYQSRFKDEILYIITNKNTFSFNNPTTIDDLVLRPIKEIKNNSTFYFESDLIMPKEPGAENKSIYSITTIKYDNTDNSVVDSLDMLLDYSNTVYMSQNNLYVAYKKQMMIPWFYYRFGNQQPNIDVFKEIYPKVYPREIQAQIENNLSDNEKIIEILNGYFESLDSKTQEKLYQEIQIEVDKYYQSQRKEYEKTYINKIELRENGKLGDITTGEVFGNLLNQFSLDEDNEGYLRVAITYTGEDYKSLNGVVILDSDLEKYSELLDLAKDERIYSVRFMGDKVYLVTFKQIDPFFVIDLKNKKSPEVLGYLKIPGYSNYLHPINDYLILGVGQDTKESEWGGVINSGVKISLFDVSNYSDPKEVATYKVFSENSYTPIQQDHKAFLYINKENLIVIPVLDYYYTTGNNKTNFYLLEVNENEILEREIIVHENNIGYNNILRSLYIDNELYTISDRLIKTYNFDTETETEKEI
ncbi:MAG: beta-propeller domain-containing protein [Candidatus ainarchaeum sp.]|nr:beta-propeller domain-containing protein [Candidatus ainarchaeum sp.]